MQRNASLQSEKMCIRQVKTAVRRQDPTVMSSIGKLISRSACGHQEIATPILFATYQV